MEREKIVRNFLLAIAVLMGLFLVYKMSPRIVLSKTVRMNLVKNRESVSCLTNARNTDFSWTARISRIEFPEGTELVHPDRGPLGYQNDFFMDFETEMTVVRGGLYVFGVASDDGFRFWIKDNMVGEYLTNRPFTTNLYTVNIQPGTYTYRLSYYQGFGRLGLTATYKYLEDRKTYAVGRNSPFIRFSTR